MKYINFEDVIEKLSLTDNDYIIVVDSETGEPHKIKLINLKIQVTEDDTPQ